MHIVDYQTSKILIKNVSNEAFYIFRYYKLEHLINIVYNNCFLTNAQFPFDKVNSPFLSYQFSSYSNKSLLLPTNSSIKTVLDNRVKIYENVAAVK